MPHRLRQARLVVLLALAGSVVGCESQRTPTSTPQFLQSRYVASALPDGGMGLFVEASMARRRGDMRRATQLLEQAIVADEELILAHKLLGELYLDQQQPQRAEQRFRTLVQRDSQTAVSHVRLGQALEALNRLADALSSYLTSVSLDSRTFGGRLGAGRVLVQLDRPAEAVEHLQVATEVEPASGEAWSTLAVAYQETDESQDAAAAFDRAIELVSVQDAGRYDLLLAAGRAAAMIGDNGSARDRLNQARQLRPDSAEPVRLMATLQNTRAIEARQRGDEAEAVRRYEDAARLLEEAVLLDPGDARLLTTLGSIRIQLWLLGGKLDPTLKQKGLDAWQRSLELDPSQRQVEAALKRYGQQ